MLLPAAVKVGHHPPQAGQFAWVGSVPVSLDGQPARALPVTHVPGHDAAQHDQLAPVLVPLGLHPFERGFGARDVARRQARARLLRSQPGHALRGRDLDRLRIRGRRAGLAGAVQELRAQRKEDRARLLVPVLEGQLGPLGAVAVGTHAGSPLGRPGEQRDGLPRAAGAQQVVRYHLGRSVVRRKQRGGLCMHAAQRLLG